MPTPDDTLVYFGGAAKVLDASEGEVKIGGPLVRFGRQDLHGEHFTSDTYFGAQMKRRGEAVLDTMFNHGIATDPQLKALAEHRFPPLTATRTDAGVMAEVILDERDDYESMLAELAEEGKLGWSSGSAPHAVQKADDGEIKRWPLVEGSLTHTPAEPRTSAVPLKALVDQEDDNANEQVLHDIRAVRRGMRQSRLAHSIRSIRQSIRA